MSLKKYTAVFKTSFKESLAYRFDAFTSAAFSFVKIYLAYLLWQAIFSGKETIDGYTFPMMLTYYIIITFIIRLSRSESIIWETSEEVRNGSFTKFITRPLSHFSYCLARSASKSTFALIVDTLAFIIWITIFHDNFYIPNNPMVILYCILFIILGLYTMMQIHYMIGLISFKTIDIAGPYFFFNNFIDFMSGSFIPLMLLPDAIEKVLAYTPFYYILYFPASLYLEQGLDKVPYAVIVIFSWNIVLMAMRKIMFKRMLALYEGVGS